MHRVLRPWIATVLFTVAMLPAAEAGQNQLLVRTYCNAIPYSITPDAGYIAVRICTGSIWLMKRNVGVVALVNHASGSTDPANAEARYPIVSDDGAFVAFNSTATDLVPGQTDSVGTENVFLFERATGQNTLISQRQSPGGPTGSYPPGPPSISADGRYVVFESRAHDLVPGQVDIPDTVDLFLYDRVAGTLVLLSHAAGSTVTAANARSEQPTISKDGAFVLFNSAATNLVSGQSDANGDFDLFLYDRASGTTTLISRASGSPTTTAAGSSFGKEISDDGRYVAFSSNAGNLVAGQIDPVHSLDVFLFDRDTGTTSIVSHQSGAPTTTGSGNSGRPSMSDDGRYIAFDSNAGDLAAGTTDTSFSLDTFVYDRISDTSTLVSHAPGAPTEAASSSYAPKISGDGSFVAFVSSGPHLAGQEYNGGRPDLFLYDRASAAIVLVTRSHLSPIQDANDGFYPFDDEWFIDKDGSHVVFPSGATDLDPSDENGGFQDVWSFDNGIQGHFYTVAPCRLVDTRTPADSPALTANVTRLFAAYGRCGIPVTAKALALNVTVLQTPGAGHVILYPGDILAPMASTLNFGAGQTRSNNALALLASNANGTFKVRPMIIGSGGTMHVLLDVTGYFE